MQSTANAERTVLYLGSDNEQEWSRLRRAIELTEGFALYLTSVQDAATTNELIRRLQHGFLNRTTYHVTIADTTELTVADLLQRMMHLPPESLVILSGLDEHKLPADFWMRFNERRNLWQRHGPYVHLWLVNNTIRQQIRTHAPDIYSIRSLDFLFTLPPLLQERLSESQSKSPLSGQETADSLLAEAQLLATDQTLTGRLLYGRSLVPVVQRLRFEGRLAEALQYSQQGLSLAMDLASPSLQAAFLVEMGITEYRLHQLGAAQTHLQTALALYRQEKEGWGEANTLKALGDLKVRMDNLTGAPLDYGAALPIYRDIHDRLGEANTLKALGDLKVRVADLTGARHDYDAALPIYRDIHDRLGEANCRQGLGRLLVAEGKAEAAFVEFRTGLTMRIDVQDSLGVGASLGNMGRTANAVKKPALAVLLFEEALSIHKAIHDIFGQALDLRSQAEALWSLNETEGALAAWQQALTLFRHIQDSSAAQIEAIFAKLAEQMPSKEFQALMAHLQTNGEELRTQAIARVEDMAREDQELQEIRSLLHQPTEKKKGETRI